MSAVVITLACVGVQAQTITPGRGTGVAAHVYSPMARVVVPGGLNTGGGNGYGSRGLRGVTVRTAMIQQQMLARQYFVHGGVNLNGRAVVPGEASTGNRTTSSR